MLSGEVYGVTATPSLLTLQKGLVFNAYIPMLNPWRGGSVKLIIWKYYGEILYRGRERGKHGGKGRGSEIGGESERKRKAWDRGGRGRGSEIGRGRQRREGEGNADLREREGEKETRGRGEEGRRERERDRQTARNRERPGERHRQTDR